MSETKVKEFSYYNQKGELVVKGGYTINREEGTYMNNLLNEYTAGYVFSGNNNKDWTEVSSEDSIMTAIKGGIENITLTSSIELTKPVEVTEGSVEVNLGDANKVLSCPKSDVFVVTGGTLTLSGKGTVAASEDNSSSACAVWAKKNGNVVINGGTYKVGDDTSNGVTGNWRNDCIYARDNGQIVINGGEFMYTGDNPVGHTFLLNCRDADYRAGKCNIVVKGGIFHNFNPGASNGENPIANFLAEGYKSVTRDGGKTFEVIPE